MAEHRFRPFLEELRPPVAGSARRFCRSPRMLDTTDFGLNSLPTERMARGQDAPRIRSRAIMGSAVFLADWNHRDLAMAAFRYRSTRRLWTMPASC